MNTKELKPKEKLSYVTLKSMLLSNTLPANFVNYSMAGAGGRTLAHVAAAIGTLPSWFKDMHLTDDAGITVGSIVANRRAQNEQYRLKTKYADRDRLKGER
jgi:hypothetical protein